jgi:flagellar biogenesis protein FliO
MLTFDEPYLGKITKKREENSTILMLDNIQLKESITKNIDSPIIQKFQILPYKKQIFIKVDAHNPYTIEASKTVDNYGLRIRIKPNFLKTLQVAKFETKKEQDISGSFIKVILLLSFMIFLLYFLKRWLEGKNQTTASWLFGKDKNSKENIQITKQKALDTKNRVTLIEYNGTSYLMILGTTNILLDKFKTRNDTGDKFDELLDQNSQKLDEVLEFGERR